MSEAKQALVLHLVGRSEPLLIAIDPREADKLSAQLPTLLRAAEVGTVTAANGSAITVNFAHVAAAHVDVAPALGQLYGASRQRADYLRR